MLVMPADCSGFMVGWLSATYPGRLAWLLNATCWRQNPKNEMPWAMDNGAFGAWTHKREWNETEFYRRALVKWKPPAMWIAVPDVVTDRAATIEMWRKHSTRLSGFPLAFVVQDGMTAADVPGEAAVVFVGGSTEWKWSTVRGWCKDFPRVHVGRVNTERMLWMAHECGAESCDGTGWFRGNQRQLAGLVRYLKESTTGKQQQELKLIGDENANDK
jgi:hypothetical protein